MGILVVASTLAVSALTLLVADTARRRTGLIGIVLVLGGAVYLATLRSSASSPVRASRRSGGRPSRPSIPTHPPEHPEVSVIVTTFDDAAHIGDCLRSIRRQRGVDWECIVMDDDSSDDTLSAIMSRVGHDPRFVVHVNDRNVGLAAQRNAGVSLARADVIAFVDGDDFLYPWSLASRLRALRNRPHPALAGVYARWRSVPANAALPTKPRKGSPAPNVTWFSTAGEAVPFIVTSPVLVKASFLAVGGFRPMAVAEDADLWQRMLRAGFFFGGVPQIGVGYRQRPASMLRRRAAESARFIADMVDRQFSPLDEPLIGPLPFTRPLQEYQAPMVRVRRLIGAIAFDLAVGRDVSSLIAEVEAVASPFMEWCVGYEDEAKRGATRAALALAEQDMDQDELARRITAELQPLIDDAHTRAATWRSVSATPALDTGHTTRRAVTAKTLKPLPAAPKRSPLAGRVVIIPSAGYHVAEAGPLAGALAARGIESAFLVGHRWWRGVRQAAAGYPVESYMVDETLAGIDLAAAVVTFNDWAVDMRAAVAAANDAGVPTFGKVEGVQDFADTDTGKDRTPYRTVAHILAQGHNDVAALADRPSTVVGSTRLERIWLADPRPAPADPLAVINLNFTFGVLTEARDLWLSTAVEACRTAGISFVVSRHPAEKSEIDPSIPVADAPMRHLLTKASVLISRFSTVPFEAMARGVPFVYHNPHGERVGAFAEPEGAYEISTDVEDLTTAIGRCLDRAAHYRSVAEGFFRQQIDIDPSTSSEERGADVVASVIR